VRSGRAAVADLAGAGDRCKGDDRDEREHAEDDLDPHLTLPI
jgi:hypothetical protein